MYAQKVADDLLLFTALRRHTQHAAYMYGLGYNQVLRRLWGVACSLAYCPSTGKCAVYIHPVIVPVQGVPADASVAGFALTGHVSTAG